VLEKRGHVAKASAVDGETFGGRLKAIGDRHSHVDRPEAVEECLLKAKRVLVDVGADGGWPKLARSESNSVHIAVVIEVDAIHRDRLVILADLEAPPAAQRQIGDDGSGIALGKHELPTDEYEIAEHVGSAGELHVRAALA
jgi:hypothetical protein